MTGWAEQLDRLETCLADSRRALADGRPQDVVTWAPAEQLGPVPPHLVDRLVLISVAADALTAELSGQAALVAEQLQHLATRTSSTRRATPSYVDTRA